MLKDKKVVIGVTGGIAAYKACDIISMLKKDGAECKVIMTKNALEFVTPLTFETLTENEVTTDTFKRKEEFDVKHISLAKWADLFVIVPATADIIGKIANGIADDMLSTTIMATKAPVLICPAMNTVMYQSAANKANMDLLKSRGYLFVDSATGRLACGDTGIGKLASVNDIYTKILELFEQKVDFAGKKVLVTLGATREYIDPVRFISNPSSGKMGSAIVENALERGASVTVIAGTHTAPINNRATVVDVLTTNQMCDEVIKRYKDFDFVVMAAAPADYTPAKAFDTKYKGDSLTLELEKTKDIAASVGSDKGDVKLVCFAAETDHTEENAKKKLLKKNADLIVLNDVSVEGAGFNVDTNIVTIFTKDGDVTRYPMMSKVKAAEFILDAAVNLK